MMSMEEDPAISNIVWPSNDWVTCLKVHIGKKWRPGKRYNHLSCGQYRGREIRRNFIYVFKPAQLILKEALTMLKELQVTFPSLCAQDSDLTRKLSNWRSSAT
uniref:Septin-2 n=1 Tax=Anthurium amnicola TaxID=1678845 RepID=A0A1D1ZF80_9ARAE